MSDYSLKRFLGEGIFSSLLGTPNKNLSIPVTSRTFAQLVQSVNSTSSKFEEEQIVNRELQTIKENLKQPDISLPQKRECLCRVLYCHMLGYDVSWSYVDCLNLVCQGSLLEKRIGYLACCLFLDRNEEITLLLTSTMLYDMKSSNFLNNMAAVTAASQLISETNIPYLLEYVLELLKHPRELVRQKGVMCLHQFQLLAPDLLEHNTEDLQRALYDKDPGVMAAAVHVVKYQILKYPEKYESIGQSLLEILRQVIDRKMSSAFEYHSIQLPWLQIQILQCLSTLVLYHERLKGDLCVLMGDMLQKLNVKEVMGIAILYESICCIIVMKPDRTLLDLAAQHVGRLLRSSDANLRYVGVKALIQLVQADSQYAMNYQTLIVDSLESDEVNIQKKMYKLLYQIANDTNVEAVCSKLLKYFSMTTDKYWRSEVVSMVIDLVERFPVSPEWQIQTVFVCVQEGGDLIGTSTLRKVLHLLEKEYVVKSDIKSQQILVKQCVSCMLVKTSTPSLIHIASWALGELCSLLQKMPEDRVVSLFTKHLCDPDLPFTVKSSLVSALQKVFIAQFVNPATMAEKLTDCLLQQHFVIKQRLSVLLQVCRATVRLEKVEANSVDTTLSFLDGHVCQCLESGGSPYIPPHLRQTPSVVETADAKLFTSTPETTGSTEGRIRSCSKSSSSKTVGDDDPGITIGPVKRVWGRQGRLHRDVQSDDTQVGQDGVACPQSKEKSELVTALFSGLSTNTKPKAGSSMFDEEEEEEGFTSEVASDSGWRQTLSNLNSQSQSTYSPGLASNTDTDIELVRNNPSNSGDLDINTTDMLGIGQAFPGGQGQGSSTSTGDFQGLDLNSTALDLQAGHDTANTGYSLESTNDGVNDALSSIQDENSSFLNISVSSTDQNQISFTHTKYVPLNVEIGQHQGVPVTGETHWNSSEKVTGVPASIYSEDVSQSLYDDDELED